jgi:hypothetical protein
MTINYTRPPDFAVHPVDVSGYGACACVFSTPPGGGAYHRGMRPVVCVRSSRHHTDLVAVAGAGC